jgi:hypothetical protein
MLSPLPLQKNYMFLQVQSVFTKDRNGQGGTVCGVPTDTPSILDGEK